MVNYHEEVQVMEVADITGLDIIKLVSIVLQKIIAENITNAQAQAQQQVYRGSEEAFMKFRSSYVPEVAIVDYLDRIKRYSKCNDSCFVLVLVYIDRLVERKSLHLTPLNIHRLLITSVMLAAKYHEDLFYNNAYYAQIGGLSLQELNALEIEMLNGLEYGLYVSNKEYGKYVHHLISYNKSIAPPPAPAPTPFTIMPPNFIPATCVNAFQFSPHSPTGHVPATMNNFSPTNYNNNNNQHNQHNLHNHHQYFPLKEHQPMLTHHHQHHHNHNHETTTTNTTISYPRNKHMRLSNSYDSYDNSQHNNTDHNHTHHTRSQYTTQHQHHAYDQSNDAYHQSISMMKGEYFNYHPSIPSTSTSTSAPFPAAMAATMFLYNFTTPLGNNNPYFYLSNFGK